MQMDWVKRKAIGEQFVEEQKDDIWRELCAALASATDSFSVHYGGAARWRQESDHQFRVAIGRKRPYLDVLIDVLFAPPEVRVVCDMGQCKMTTYTLNPSKDKPFRNAAMKPLSVEELSEAILRCSFFPAESRGVQTPVVTPCSG